MGTFVTAVLADSTRNSYSNINELTGAVIGAAIKIHRRLGPGLLESAYEACMSHELKALGLHVERQKPVPLIYEGVRLDCGFSS
jgi:GxxExxY protein